MRRLRKWLAPKLAEDAAAGMADASWERPDCFQRPRALAGERIRQLVTALLYLLPLGSFALSLLSIVVLLVSLIVALFAG